MHNQLPGHTASPHSVRNLITVFHEAAMTFSYLNLSALYYKKNDYFSAYFFCSSFIQQLNCDNLSQRVGNLNYYYSVKATGSFVKSTSDFKAPRQLL